MTETTQSGISDNGAGALAYLTFLPAIFFLVLPPYNASASVRFNAWQSIFLNVAGFAIFLVLAILGRIPIVGFFVMVIDLLLMLAFVILWMVIVLKTLSGRKVVLPGIGPLAEAQALQ